MDFLIIPILIASIRKGENIIEKKSLIALIIYIIAISICFYYFFYDTKEYESINSLSNFAPKTLVFFLVTSGYILYMAFGDKKDKEVLFKMIVWFIIGIGSTTLLYEFVKPS